MGQRQPASLCLPLALFWPLEATLAPGDMLVWRYLHWISPFQQQKNQEQDPACPKTALTSWLPFDGLCNLREPLSF